MSAGKGKIKPGATVLICVEGKDEESFIDKFLTDKGANKDTYDIQCVGGANQFHIKMPLMVQQENFQNIKTLAIVRDAEKSFARTLDSIRNTLKKYQLPAPDAHGVFTPITNGAALSVGFFIMPGDQQDGMLENLCLDWFKNDRPELWKCLEDYHRCIESKLQPPITNLPKAKALMMLATTPDDANNLGTAARQGFFNFASPVWQALHDFFKSAGLIF